MGKVNVFFCSLYGNCVYLNGSGLSSAPGKVSLHAIPQSLHPSLNTVFQRKRNNRLPPWGPWNEGDESLCFSSSVVVCMLIEGDMRKLDQMVVLNPLAKWHALVKKKKNKTELQQFAQGKKRTTRTHSSFVSYYPTKYLFKVSPYVETWHMLQLVFWSYLAGILLKHLIIGTLPIW